MTAHPWLKHYDAGVPATLGAYPARTLLDYLRDGVAERPDAPALLFKGRSISWKELDDASDALACAFLELGITRGERVAVLLPNCPQFFVIEFALWKIGAVLVPLNPVYTENELLGPIRTTTPSWIIVLTAFYEKVKAVQPKAKPSRVILTNIKEWFPPLLKLLFTVAKERKDGHRARARDGDPWLKDLIASKRGQRPPAYKPGLDDDALLLMSGGTTGAPKAVRIHHHGLVQTGLQVCAWLAAVLPPWEGIYCLPLPLFHSYSACGVQSVCIIGHNPIALVPNPRDIDDLVKTIELTKPSVFCGVPTLYHAMLENPRVKAGLVDFHSMKACASGAAPMLEETHRRFREVTGARVIEGYALTESLLAATISPLHGPVKIGSVGTPLPDVDVRVVDSDDASRELPAGEIGEILLHGPQIMHGYHNAPEGTDQILHTHADGKRWLHTADLGYLDTDGYLFIVDRKKDLIKMGGMQVWPRQIEEVLAQHPAVSEVGVRGFPDAARGEVAVAFVVRRTGHAVSENDLRDWCKARLAPYKVPARVVFRRSLPKTLVGKVLRRLLTEEEGSAA